MKDYRLDLDVLKGLAIIFVVFYHLGIINSGYLGVDLFLTINGFLIIPPLVDKILSNSFNYGEFLIKRVSRLLPLIVIASFISLIIGWFWMLPDSYENLSEEVVASNLFGENILASITTKNYWDVDNGYKPLMHLWYIGIVVQFYLIFPLVLLFGKRCAILLKKDVKSVIDRLIVLLFGISLLLFLLPIDSFSNKFYYLQYRLFEFLAPIVLYLLLPRFFEKANKRFIYLINLIALLFFLGSSLLVYGELTTPIIGGGTLNDNAGLLINKTPALLIVVFLSSLLVLLHDKTICMRLSGLGAIGKRSYSIFIWHQVIIAFYRCYFTDELSLFTVLLYLLVVLIVSEVSYRLVEQKNKPGKSLVLRYACCSAFLIIPSIYIYMHAGVIRDVEELNVKVSDAHRGMHGEYCDRVYKYETGFPQNDKINVLIMGNSFARDMGNVLLESNMMDSINLSYISNARADFWKAPTPQQIEIVRSASVLFIFCSYEDVPGYVLQNINTDCKLYGIGTKNFGKNNGPIFFRRNQKNYYCLTNTVIDGYCELNEKWKDSWGDNYVDFMSYITTDRKNVIVFTPNKKYISADCGHLTQEGARWFADVLPIKEYLSK